MADGKFKFTSDAEQVQRDLLDLARKVAKLEAENVKLKSAADSQAKAFKAAKVEQQTMLQQGLRGASRLALGYTSITSAIQLATAAIARMRAEQERAVSSLEKMQSSRGRLNQIARDDADLAALQQTADSASGRYGFAREAASTAVFGARSENFEQALPDVFRFSAAGADLEQVSKVAGQLPTLFANAIDSQQAIAATFVAARESRLDFGEIGDTLPTVAEGAKAAGSAASEAIAVASVLASQFAAGTTSADRIKAFGSAVGIAEDPRLKGQGIVGATEALSQMSEADRRKFLGASSELNAAYNALLQELPNIQERQQKIAAEIEATRGGFGEGSQAAAFIARAEQDQGIQGAIAQAAAENRKAIAEERRFAKEAVDRNVAALDANTAAIEGQRGFFQRWAVDSLTAAASSVGADASAVSALGSIASASQAFNPLTIAEKAMRYTGQNPLTAVPQFARDVVGMQPASEPPAAEPAAPAGPATQPPATPAREQRAAPASNQRPAGPSDEQLARRVAQRQAARAGDAARNLPQIAERARQRQAADASQPVATQPAAQPTTPPPRPAAVDPMADVQQRIDRNLADLGRKLGQPAQAPAQQPAARPARRSADAIQADINRNLADLGRQLGQPNQPAAAQPAAPASNQRPAGPSDEQLARRVAQRQAARAGDAARNLPQIAERARQRQAADASQPVATQPAAQPTTPPPRPAAVDPMAADPMADVQQRIDRNLADLGRKLGQPAQAPAQQPAARPARRDADAIQADIDRNLADLGRQLGQPNQPAAAQPAARPARRDADAIQADINRNLRDLGRNLGQPAQAPAQPAARPRTVADAERRVEESMEHMRRTFNQPQAETRVSFAPPQQSRRSEDLLAQIAGDMRTVAAASQAGGGGRGSLPAFRDRNVRPGIAAGLVMEPA